MKHLHKNSHFNQPNSIYICEVNLAYRFILMHLRNVVLLFAMLVIELSEYFSSVTGFLDANERTTNCGCLFECTIATVLIRRVVALLWIIFWLFESWCWYVCVGCLLFLPLMWSMAPQIQTPLSIWLYWQMFWLSWHEIKHDSRSSTSLGVLFTHWCILASDTCTYLEYSKLIALQFPLIYHTLCQMNGKNQINLQESTQSNWPITLLIWIPLFTSK